MKFSDEEVNGVLTTHICSGTSNKYGYTVSEADLQDLLNWDKGVEPFVHSSSPIAKRL
jgi:hypothetical protein